MVKIFRNIRQKLAAENNVAKYLRYAIGEIILVVIGILIALQVNNWNENRKSEVKFNAVLEQIYTIVDQDVQEMNLTENTLRQKNSIIDSLMHYPDKMEPALLPSLLYYIDKFPDVFTSEALYQIDLLEFNPKNLLQSKLYKSIAFYVFNKLNIRQFSSPQLTPLLKNLHLPEPALLLGYSALNDYENMDRTLFSKEQQKKVLEIINSNSFKVALKSAKSQNDLAVIMVQNEKSSALTCLDMIKQYYPAARLLYQNIGIVGDATENKNYIENVPMTLINETQSIWEATVKLGEGSVKFRDGNSWLANWGGEKFPSGEAKWFGQNISVKPGYYRVTINLTDKTYKFELIKE